MNKHTDSSSSTRTHQSSPVKCEVNDCTMNAWLSFLLYCRLVTGGTVDEGILHVAEHKLHLDAALLSNSGVEGKGCASTTNEDGQRMASILTSIIGSST